MSQPLIMTVACAVALALAGCSSGDSESSRQATSSNIDDRRELDSGEIADIDRLRSAAFAAGQSGTSYPLLPDTTPVNFFGMSRLSWTALRHAGYLSSTTSLAQINPAETTFDCGTGVGVSPDWALDVSELDGSVPMATITTDSTTYPTTTINNTKPPQGPSDPLYRYIWNNWADAQYDTISNPPVTDPIIHQTTPGVDASVFEYSLREPYLPDRYSSRVLTAWMNRDGRLALMRAEHDRWGFGSAFDASLRDRNVRFGPSPYLSRGGASDFRGVFALRVNKQTQFMAVPSYWPGVAAQGAAPILYGWSFDPDTGAVDGPAIHVSGTIPPVLNVDLDFDYSPNGADSQPFHPTINGSGQIDATSDYNFVDAPTYNNGTANVPVMPMDATIYTSGCPSINGFLTPRHLGTLKHVTDSALADNEVIVVPHLRSIWTRPDGFNALPEGTYRVSIRLWTRVNGRWVVMEPTRYTENGETTHHRYFFVWNQPGFFRP